MFITGQESPDAALSATPPTGGMEAVKPLWFNWFPHGLENCPLNCGSATVHVLRKLQLEALLSFIMPLYLTT